MDRVKIVDGGMENWKSKAGGESLILLLLPSSSSVTRVRISICFWRFVVGFSIPTPAAARAQIMTRRSGGRARVWDLRPSFTWRAKPRPSDDGVVVVQKCDKLPPNRKKKQYLSRRRSFSFPFRRYYIINLRRSATIRHVPDEYFPTHRGAPRRTSTTSSCFFLTAANETRTPNSNYII